MTAQFLEGRDYRTGRPVRVTVAQGRIQQMTELPETDCAAEWPWLAPGLVDLQVNGYGGHDLNAADLSAADVVQLTERLWALGVTGYMPTLVSNHPDALDSAIRAIVQALRTDERVRQTVLGIHLEGPFISVQDGPRGAHELRWVRPPDWPMFARLQSVAEGAIRLVTLSPEWPQAQAFIRACVQAGVRVAIGHTAANAAQIAEAVRAGATLSTHLGNGAHATLPRHPNYLWDQLANDGLWTSLIGDGHHVPTEFLKVALRVKGWRAFLVSDTVALAGMSPGQHETPVGGKVVLTADGRLHLAESPQLLAGSAMSLVGAVGRMVTAGIVSFAEAWGLASLRPAAYLGIPDVAFAVGRQANLVALRMTVNGPRVEATWLDGRQVYGVNQHNGFGG